MRHKGWDHQFNSCKAIANITYIPSRCVYEPRIYRNLHIYIRLFSLHKLTVSALLLEHSRRKARSARSAPFHGLIVAIDHDPHPPRGTVHAPHGHRVDPRTNSAQTVTITLAVINQVSDGTNNSSPHRRIVGQNSMVKRHDILVEEEVCTLHPFQTANRIEVCKK